MMYWTDIVVGRAVTPYREQFVRIMKVMDPRYGALKESDLDCWLTFPCTAPGYEHDHLYAFGGFSRQIDVGNPERMQLVLLARHEGANQPAGGNVKVSAQLLMLGWIGASADPATLDETIDVVVDKGIAWLAAIGLSDSPIRCFRPYEMGYGNVRLLHDRICQRALATPADRIQFVRRVATSDGEYWKLRLS